MADELKQAAAQVDRWCLILEGLIDPQLRHCEDLALYKNLKTKGDSYSQVSACKQVLEDMWETYQKLYCGAHFKRAERTAALADYKVKKYCYTAAIASTCDLLDAWVNKSWYPVSWIAG